MKRLVVTIFPQALATQLAEHHDTTDLADIHLLVKRKLAAMTIGEGVCQGDIVPLGGDFFKTHFFQFNEISFMFDYKTFVHCLILCQENNNSRLPCIN